MKTRILMSVLAIGLSIALIGGATMAWFTDEAEVPEATFTAGTVDIEVVDLSGEEQWGGQIVGNWNPGDTTPASINFKSSGSKQTYVRAKFTYEWEDGLLIDNVTVDVNEGGWIAGGDGWYYYKDILNETEETEDLFTSVKLDGLKTDNEYQGKTLTLTVEAEAVQASHEAFVEVWGIDSLPGGVQVLEEE